MRRLPAALRTVGFDVIHSGDGKTRVRTIHIKKIGNFASETSATSTNIQNPLFTADKADDGGHQADKADASLQPLSKATHPQRTESTFKEIRIVEGLL